MSKSNLEPVPRKERRISVLTLYFPVTAKLGNIGIYKLDASGLRLVRLLTGARLQVPTTRAGINLGDYKC